MLCSIRFSGIIICLENGIRSFQSDFNLGVFEAERVGRVSETAGNAVGGRKDGRECSWYNWFFEDCEELVDKLNRAILAGDANKVRRQ
jgi:hypothetical protein